MSSARYVGRVGALAVALGIGAVIAGVPGVAWADTEGEPDPSDAPGVSEPKNPDSSAGDPSDTEVVGGDLGDPGDGDGVGDAGDSGDVDGADDSAGGMQVGSSGGPITSTSPGSAGVKSKQKDDDADPPKKRSALKQKVVSVAPPSTTTTTQSTAKTVTDTSRKARSQAPALSIAPKDPGPALTQSTSPPVDVAPVTLAAPGLQKPVAARMTAVTKPLAQSPVSGLLPFVTLAPTADGKQPGTTESPLLLGFLAAGREVDRKTAVEDESIARTVDSTETGLMTTATNSLFFQTKATRLSSTRDTTKPTVNLAGPTNGSGTVTVNATASDNVGVTQVKFYVDKLQIGQDTTPDPISGYYDVSWNTVLFTNGPHTLKVVAYDAAGNTTTSTRTVIVDNTKPTVSLTGPASGSTVSGPVTLRATATDNVAVAGVQFLLNETPVGEDTTAGTTPDPNNGYSVTWDTATVADGTYTLTARARDAAGNTTTSTPVSVTVNNAANHPPSANLTIGSPDPTTGAVSVTLNATDPDDDPLTYAVTAGPSAGELTMGDTPGTYSYEPFFISRFYAYPSDTFTVTVSDGQSSTNVPVTVPITAASYQLGTPITVGSGPTHVAVSDTRAYVANTTDGTVSVIDTSTNTVIATVEVGEEPGAIAVRGDRVYVANYVSGTVSVIDATNNTVAATIPVGDRPVGIAPTPDGTKVYVRNGYDVGTVTVIDTNPTSATYNTVIRTIQVGTAPTVPQSYIVVTPDSRFVYVTHAGDEGTIAVIDTATDTVVDDIDIGFYPYLLTISPDGSALFAPGGVNEWGDPATYVISTASNSVVEVRFDVGFQGFAPDGTLAYSSWYWYSDYSFNAFYVNDGNMVRDYLPLPVQGYSGLPFAASPDGIRIYVADPYAGQVYPITFNTL